MDVAPEAFIFVCILQESSCFVFYKRNIVVCTLPTHPVSGREVLCRVKLYGYLVIFFVLISLITPLIVPNRIKV